MSTFACSIKLILANSLSSTLSEIINCGFMGNRFSLFRSNSREKLKAKFDDDCLGAKVKQVYSIPVELFTSIGKKKCEAFSNLLKTLKLHEEKNA